MSAEMHAESFEAGSICDATTRSEFCRKLGKCPLFQSVFVSIRVNHNQGLVPIFAPRTPRSWKMNSLEGINGYFLKTILTIPIDCFRRWMVTHSQNY